MDILEVCKQLTKEIPENQIYIDEPMSKHTTFKVGGVADIFLKVKSVKELEHVIKVARKSNIAITIIGNGSNTLVKDKGVRGIVIGIAFDNIEIEKSEKNEAIVTVGAGVKLITLAQLLQKNSITGFEFASSIPGTIGGAVKMNAGAHGGEMKDIVISTKCFDLKKAPKNNEIAKSEGNDAIVELDNKTQKFSYRDSVFSTKRYIIIETKLKLFYGDAEEVKNKMDLLMNDRREKQPNLPSAGSTFKRGEDYITAKLIDECGLKGYTIGGAQVSEKHAGFVVNTGNATAQDILDLTEHIKKVVYKKTGKSISLEIEVIGE